MLMLLEGKDIGDVGRRILLMPPLLSIFRASEPTAALFTPQERRHRPKRQIQKK
ncbi:hypothetical protein YC2023_009194 [Brassica napus]